MVFCYNTRMANDIHTNSFIIEGSAGKRVLSGKIKVGGAKNDALKIILATTLFKGRVKITRIPDTEDTQKALELMRLLGADVVVNDGGTFKGTASISTDNLTSTSLDHELSKSMRASIVGTGPLLARYGNVSFPAPGGCVIGARPVDLFIEGYKKMGAQVEIKGDRYVITSPKNGLKGAEIIFPMQTVGGTETLMMTAVLAQGKTILKNCAMEPEIVNLGKFLIASGAKITGLGTPTIEIVGRGKKALLKAKKPYLVIPDRLETGSFLLLGALLAKDVTITDCDPGHIEVLITMLRDSGVPIEVKKHNIRVTAPAEGTVLSSFNVRTHEYPGFPTDLQAQMATYLTQASGQGLIFETIFEGRFKYTEELETLGARVTIMNPREILVKGPTPLHASVDAEPLHAHDIRAGFAVVMAALTAKGTSVVKNVYVIDRGYERLEKRLAALGASIRRISDSVIM